MAVVQIGRWTVDVDVEATRAAYRQRTQGSPEECGCLECRNFAAARRQAYPAAVREALATLGVEPIREAEIFHLGPLDSGWHLYGGWFHVVGHLVEGADAKVPLDVQTGTFDLEPMDEHFRFGITTDTVLVPRSFPSPPSSKWSFRRRSRGYSPNPRGPDCQPPA